MNTEKFIEGADRFELGELQARLAFKTIASIGFNLYKGSMLDIEGVKSRPMLRNVGSIDVHSPCSGEIKTRIRVFLSEGIGSAQVKDANDLTAFKRMVAAILNVVEILDQDLYQADFILPDGRLSLANGTPSGTASIERHLPSK